MGFEYTELFNEKVNVEINNFYNLIKSYLLEHEISMVMQAVNMAEQAHHNQFRKSGEPYIIHPIEVASIVARWGLDVSTIIGALLHDTIEDSEFTKEDIEKQFGSVIANMVDSLTKLDCFQFDSKEQAHAEYVKKLILAMSQDIRIILIKLADRKHNMQTIAFMRPDKQISISKETMEIYVPIAYKLGLYKLHIELAEQCFKYVYPLRYKMLVSSLQVAQSKNSDTHNQIKQDIYQVLQQHNLDPIIVTATYSFYKLYQRIKKQSKKSDYKYYSIEFKIIVNELYQCYMVLGILHNLFQPIPDKFKDLIALPRANGYQSLHTMLMAHNIPIFIQIRTKQMHQVSEYGVISKLINKQHINHMANNLINNVVDIQKSNESSAIEFLKLLKNNLSSQIVYVFTFDREIIYLPYGSSVLDFAYFIDENLGNKTSKVKINHKFTSIFYKLKNGDLIDIITNESNAPKKSWLKHVITNKAYNSIMKHLNN
jgi:guanosine-3',5'-bis(diphosphate) 3'-pyrophosphohydrolase